MSIFTVLGLSSSYRAFDYLPAPLEYPCNWFFVFQALRCPRNPNFSFFTTSLRRTTAIRWSGWFSDAMVRCPRNLAIAFRLISRFVTEGCTENGGRLWYLCKQVEAMRGWLVTFILFASGILVQLLFFTYFKM